MIATPPGAYRPLHDHWASFAACARSIPPGALVVLDRRVAALHPSVPRALAQRDAVVATVAAGEGAKTLGVLERVMHLGVRIPRSGTVVAIGGGTIGDLSTVVAHLLKRGVRLVHAPTTLLAAVDSSVGGKGAVDLVSRGLAVKNAIGVFHYADESWLCRELFSTLDARQRREGAIEAWKMVACLDAKRWRRYRSKPPGLETLVREGRRIKAAVCARDPYEQSGLRQVLNFGHTFGHVIESVSRFRVAHGDAVGMGILCALDVGRALGVTPAWLASEVEEGLRMGPRAPGRGEMAGVFAREVRGIASLLAADKKVDGEGNVRMVLLRELGVAVVQPVPPDVWRAQLRHWRRGVRP